MSTFRFVRGLTQSLLPTQRYRCSSTSRPSPDLSAMTEEYSIASATADELHIFHDIQKSQGWEPFDQSYRVFESFSKEGMLLGRLSGEVISSFMGLRYSPGYAFLALYWVDKRFRGKQYGIQIFKRVLETLKDCDIVGLDADPGKDKVYEKWGYKVLCDSTSCTLSTLPKVYGKRSFEMASDKKLIDLKELATFDAQCFPAYRQVFLGNCIEIGHPFVARDPHSKAVVGYAILMPRENSYTIAPLVALSD